LNDELLLSHLEGLAYKLGIEVRYENVNWEGSSSAGGLCRLQGEYVLIIDFQATTKNKIMVIIEALKRFDLGDIYVKPVIRKLLEGSKE